MTTLTVKVIKADKPTYWYADKIGHTFEVYPEFKYSDVTKDAKFNCVNDGDYYLDVNNVAVLIGGKEYRYVDRNPVEGDLVHITKFAQSRLDTAVKVDEIRTIERITYDYEDEFIAKLDEDIDDQVTLNSFFDTFSIIEPLTSAQPIDQLAHLALKYVDAERRLGELSRKYDELAADFQSSKAQLEANDRSLGEDVDLLKDHMVEVKAGVNVTHRDVQWAHARITNTKSAVSEDGIILTGVSCEFDSETGNFIIGEDMSNAVVSGDFDSISGKTVKVTIEAAD